MFLFLPRKKYYDVFSNPKTTTDAFGTTAAPSTQEWNEHTTTYEYDLLGRKTNEIDPPISAATAGPTTIWTYNADDTVATLQDADGNVTSYGYDNIGRQISETTTLGTTSSVYDTKGNLAQTTDRNNKVIKYTYDGLNRLSTEKWYDNATATAATDKYCV